MIGCLRSCVQGVCIFLLACPSSQASQPSLTELTVKTPDVTLQARVAGQPNSENTIIAINGGPGLSSQYMLSLEQLAQHGLAVISYDQRGVGRSSSPPDDDTSYTLLKYVEDLEAVRKASGVEKVHLLGHSWGGIVAMRYTTMHPERVHSVILVNSGPPTWDGVIRANTALARRIQALQMQGVIAQNIQPGDVKAVLPAYFSDPTFWFSVDDQGGPPAYNNTVNRRTMSVLMDFDITAQVAEIDLPVLILMGQDDPFDLPMAEEVHDALLAAQVEFIVLEDCGHFWHECPEAFMTQVRRFLRTIPQGAEDENQD